MVGKNLTGKNFSEGNYPDYFQFCKKECNNKAINSLNYIEKLILHINNENVVNNYKTRIRQARKDYCDNCRATRYLRYMNKSVR